MASNKVSPSTAPRSKPADPGKAKSEEQIRAMLTEQEESGLSVAEYCELEGLCEIIGSLI